MFNKFNKKLNKIFQVISSKKCVTLNISENLGRFTLYICV